MNKILLINAQPKLLTEILTFFGYEVDVALNSTEVTQKLFNMPQQYEAVIIDLDNPSLDGMNIIKQMQNSLETISPGVIVLSSNLSDKMVIGALREGADLFLSKSISARILNAQIQALLRRLGQNISNNWDLGAFVTVTEPNIRIVARLSA